MYKHLLQTISQRIPRNYVQPQPSKSDLIIVAMSSGVDSSVAASFYKDFPNVQGIFMQNWNQLDSNRCLEQDYKDVQKVAEHLKIPLELCNFEKDYWTNVFEPMIDDYSKGITPNPDINCNRFVKFGRLIDFIENRYKNENYWLVTGHYSRILRNISTNKAELHKAFHKPKDQSYYLSQINPSILSKLLLPVGHFTKPEIRSLAASIHIPTATKPDSTGLCFVNPSQGKFNDFLQQFIPDSPGPIKDTEGKVWGEHQGLWSYTRGQKIRGISMPQGDPKYRGQWYVSEKRIKENEIIIVRGMSNESLYDQAVYVEEFLPLIEDFDVNEFNAESLRAQYRSLQEEVEISEVLQDGAKLVVRFKEPKRAVSVGQYLALYHGERCLGSGMIRATE
ncbi:hypothetical protein WICPIJ_000852 [Wickerhamomyces pijperi]|uniref:tRNA-5-taurinomethyluridine 2-sulfurtransferase n=1 Tax=Wickerhamomyces pijperi TaxID=599730 RepID=A0A9P8QCR4_WICPI|nr:hypothetical protein WICPIJ_000852 [Wickerhamomyces pijperi]